jgi:hypothetical protein
MKSKFIYLVLLGILGFTNISLAQNNESTTSDTTKIKYGPFIGTTTLGGVNYQMLGFRGDFPIGKFGFGLDFQILMDNDGKVRKEDWNEWQDYLDKIYYIRYGRKGDPFYFKTGGLDHSYMGFRNIINGYSNMLEYPTVKRYGLELGFQGEKIGGEFFVNDFKEFSATKPSAIVGGRLTYKVLGKLTIGGSLVSDLNQYNGFKYSDGDDYPDNFDLYPNDGALVTEYDYTTKVKGYSDELIKYINEQAITPEGKIDTTQRNPAFAFRNMKQAVTIYSFDLGYPLISGDFFKFDIYSSFTKIDKYGWGAIPVGARFGIGSFLNISAEFRSQSKEFVFGFFDHTYETQRATSVKDPITGKLTAKTKAESLKDYTKELNGFFLGAELNLGGYVKAVFNYTDLLNGEIHDRTMRGEIGLNEKLIPNLSIGKAYYVQNNVQDFQQWKTPSTEMGYILEYKISGIGMGFQYRFNFIDKNGDGKISGSDETIKTIGLRAGMTF